jgi:hypothetical protein
MSEAATQPNGPDALIKGLVAATRGGQDEAIQAWSRGCELYARYFATLAKAKGPEGLFAANADFMTGAMETFAKSAAAAQRLNAAAVPAPKS